MFRVEDGENLTGKFTFALINLSRDERSHHVTVDHFHVQTARGVLCKQKGN